MDMLCLKTIYEVSNREVQDRFLIAVGTIYMNKAELSEYCRKKGRYPEPGKEWQGIFQQANGELFKFSRVLAI